MITPISMSPSFKGTVTIGRNLDEKEYIAYEISRHDDETQKVLIDGINNLCDRLGKVTPKDYKGSLSWRPEYNDNMDWKYTSQLFLRQTGGSGMKRGLSRLFVFRPNERALALIAHKEPYMDRSSAQRFINSANETVEKVFVEPKEDKEKADSVFDKLV